MRVADAVEDEDENDVTLPPQDASAVAASPNPIMRRVSIGFTLLSVPRCPTSTAAARDIKVQAVGSVDLRGFGHARHLALSGVTAYICLPWPRKNQTRTTR